MNDPADLGLARKLSTATCQRTESGLTVWAFGGGVAGAAGQAQITGLVDAAYNAVSGGK